MAFELHRPGFQFPAKCQGSLTYAASGKLAGVPVGYGTAAEQAVFLASGAEAWGIAKPGVYADGERVTIYEAGNYVKALAVASLGYGANVSVGSTNGALGPIAPASGAFAWSIGKAMGPAAANEVFTVRINPTRIVGAPG